MEWVPFLMLGGALALFLLSTRQFPLLIRLLVWLAGAALIGSAITLALITEGRYGLFRAVIDFFAHIGEPAGSAVVRSFSDNSPTVLKHIEPLLDLFLVLASFMGVLALFAFTPGERLERIVRPSVFVLVGMMLGGALALSLVAIGFGGYTKPRSYFAQLEANDVIDGDTIRIGETTIRLWGLDAPEAHQPCLTDSGLRDCGVEATAWLTRELSGSLIRCSQPEGADSDEPPMETFGRPIMQCFRIAAEGEQDIARMVIASGYGIEYRSDSKPIDFYKYASAESDAADRRAGLHAFCMLTPKTWRRESAARSAFTMGQAIVDVSLTIGNCSPYYASAVRAP
ncbi:MAG: hypothetical protein GC206_12725 [Alphaproteobacteria bacterium]|nr:hypothetical protein [Alphaproteobacteria bacterium]